MFYGIFILLLEPALPRQTCVAESINDGYIADVV